MTDTSVAGSAPPAPTSLLRIAVVGVGARAGIARLAVDSQEGQIVAAVDPDEAARERGNRDFGADAETFASHQELLSSGIPVDAAFVTSPDHTHAQIAIDLLTAGIAVYLEKPLAISLADADAVLEAAVMNGTPLYVGHNMRYMPVIRLMREIIDRGEIGEVKAIWCRHFVGNGGDYYFKDWHADRSLSTGLLLQKGAHDIDVIHWLAGGTTAEVVAAGDLSVYGSVTDRRSNSDRRMPDWFSLRTWPPLTQSELNPIIDVEDISMMLMRLNNGVLASYQQCHFTPDYWRNYTVIGTEGRLENFGDSGGGVVRVWNSRTTYSADGDRAYPIVGDAEGHADGDASAVADFVRFVRYGTATETSPVDARHAVAAAVAATDSLRDGSTPRSVPRLAADIIDHFARQQHRSVPTQRGNELLGSRIADDRPTGPPIGSATLKEK